MNHLTLDIPSPSTSSDRTTSTTSTLQSRGTAPSYDMHSPADGGGGGDDPHNVKRFLQRFEKRKDESTRARRGLSIRQTHTGSSKAKPQLPAGVFNRAGNREGDPLLDARNARQPTTRKAMGEDQRQRQLASQVRVCVCACVCVCVCVWCGGWGLAEGWMLRSRMDKNRQMGHVVDVFYSTDRGGMFVILSSLRRFLCASRNTCRAV